MRLTDEVIKSHEYKTGLVVPEGCHLILASELKNFIDTIEALQQEIAELKQQGDVMADTINMFAPYVIGKPEAEVVEELKELLTLRKENEQLQAQAAIMTDALTRIDNLGGGWETGVASEALHNDIADYHNPADMEALKQARYSLHACMNTFEMFVPNRPMEQAKVEIREAIAVIDKIGGREDEETGTTI